jgi:hypothetical protein
MIRSAEAEIVSTTVLRIREDFIPVLSDPIIKEKWAKLSKLLPRAFLMS